MKRNITQNKAKKFEEEERASQRAHQDKERQRLMSAVYRERGVPNRKTSSGRTRPVKRGK